jgi:hypothetical protein
MQHTFRVSRRPAQNLVGSCPVEAGVAGSVKWPGPRKAVPGDLEFVDQRSAPSEASIGRQATREPMRCDWSKAGELPNDDISPAAEAAPICAASNALFSLEL